VQAGVVAGLVAAAALGGFLLGLGRRAGTLWRPLNTVAHVVLGARAEDVWGFDTTVTATGGAVVLVMSVVAGVVATRLASSRRTLHILAAAVGVALASYLLHLHVVARSPGGLAALLSIGELRALYLTFALALVAGMRFAFFPSGETHGR
jgi:hypothetical protein